MSFLQGSVAADLKRREIFYSTFAVYLKRQELKLLI